MRLTGHSLKQVTAILDAHYLSRDSSLGASAVQKLEAARKRSKVSQLTSQLRKGVSTSVV